MASSLRSEGHHYALLIAMLAILGTLMVYPIASLCSSAFLLNGKLSLYWVSQSLQDPHFRGNLVNSLLLAGTVTIFCNLIAMPLAALQSRYQFPGQKILGALVLVPMVLPPFVGAIGMRQILNTYGALTSLLQAVHILGPNDGVNWLEAGGFWACAGLIALGLYPIAYLNLQAALANIDPAMQEAAENLGASRFTVFRRITLPLAMPGIFAGSTIIFIWAFTELGTPLLLNYRAVVSRDIWDELANISATSNGGVAFARVVIVLAISVLAYVVGKLTLGRQAHAMTSKAAVAATRTQVRGLRGLLVALPFVLVMSLAMLPHLGVILYSITAMASDAHSFGWGPTGVSGWYGTVLPHRFTFAGYRELVTNQEILTSVLNSLKYASVSTAINVVLGVAIAWVLVRTKVVGRTVLDSVAMLPLAVPGLVMAFGFYAITRKPPFDKLSPDVNPFAILVIAYAMRRMPYLVRSAVGGLQQTSVTLEEAAANMGASPLRVVWRITLPLIMANLIAGALLTFSFAMLEVSDSLILATHARDYPISKMIYGLASDNSGPENLRNACALGVLAMGLLIATIMTASALLGKRLGALFRA